MPDTLRYTGTLTVISCGNCHLQHAVPETFLEARKRDGETFYCPVGHKMSYGNDSENARLRRQLRSAEARATHAQDQAQAAEYRRRAALGQVTKIKKRIAAGVCPCCQRTFQNLAAHMAGQHPHYQHNGEPEGAR